MAIESEKALEGLINRLESLEVLISERDVRIFNLETALKAAESKIQNKKDNEKVRVMNADEKGMGHGSMGWMEEDTSKFYSAPAERNKDDILKVLEKHLSEEKEGLIIEIGSGSGQHISHFAKAFPLLQFQPTEYPGHPNPKADKQDIDKILTSISSYTKNISNIVKPCYLDASILDENNEICKDNEVLMFISINIVHVSPLTVMEGILKGSSKKLKLNGKLLFYGPWSLNNGIIKGDGNIKFNKTLKELNNDYGIRDINELEMMANSYGLSLIDTILFESSNNYCLVLQKNISN